MLIPAGHREMRQRAAFTRCRIETFLAELVGRPHMRTVHSVVLPNRWPQDEDISGVIGTECEHTRSIASTPLRLRAQRQEAGASARAHCQKA